MAGALLRRSAALLGIDPRKFQFSGVKWHDLKPRTLRVLREWKFIRNHYPDEPVAEPLNRTCRRLA